MSGYYSDGRGRGQQKRDNSSAQRGSYSSGNGRRNTYYEEDRYAQSASRGRYSTSGRGGNNRRKKKKNNFLPMLLLVVLLAVGVFAGVKYFQNRKAEEEQQAQIKLEQEQQAAAEQQRQQEDAVLGSDTIYEGVSINGIALGGMTRQQATEAVEQSLGLAEHSLTLQYNDQTFQVPLMTGSDLASVIDQAYQVGRDGTREENLAKIEEIKTQPVEFTVEAGYSLPDMTEVLNSCAQAINRKAKNATVTGFNVKDSSFTYEDGQNGLEVNQEATQAAAQAAVDAGNYDGTVTITVTETTPEMDKATLKSKFKRLATFTTTTTSNSNRNTNIRLCSQAISGAVVQPGEEFSVNTLTGQRTAAKGYKDATVIKNGVYVQEPGGGVCQVSSTLFNAVVRAGLKISERHNHTIVSSYVPIGEDAAVDYPNKDFKFINNSEGPVAVVMTFDESNKKLKASVYGIPILKDGIKLDLTSEVTQTIPIPDPTYTEDPTLEYGQEVTVTTGLEGKKVTTYLITKQDGKQISKEVLHKSNYPKRTPVIAINSKATPTESTIPEETGSTGDNTGGSTGGDTTGGDGGNNGGFDIPEE